MADSLGAKKCACGAIVKHLLRVAHQTLTHSRTSRLRFSNFAAGSYLNASKTKTAISAVNFLVGVNKQFSSHRFLWIP